MPFIIQLIYPVRAMVQALFLFPVAQQPHWGLDLLIVEVSRSHTGTHTHTHSHTHIDALGGTPLDE